MQFSSVVLTLAALAGSALGAGEIHFWGGEDCASGGETVQTPTAPSGCIELGDIHSAKSFVVEANCQFTIYAQSNCVGNPVIVPLDVCETSSSDIFSYSYTCA